MSQSRCLFPTTLKSLYHNVVAAIITRIPNASPLTIHAFRSFILSPPFPFPTAIKSPYLKYPLPSLLLNISSYSCFHSSSPLACQSCLCAGSGSTTSPALDLARCSGLMSNRRYSMKSNVTVLISHQQEFLWAKGVGEETFA